LPLREQVIAQLERKPGSDASSSDALLLDYQGGESDLVPAALSWSVKYLIRTDEEVRRSFDDLSAGRRPRRAWRAPLYRSYRISAESGIRAAVYFLIAAAVFAISGWSMTEVALSFVAIIIGRGATMPDPRAFTTMAVVGAPIAALMTGILEFVVLDGSTAFPQLAISLAPFIIGAALLTTVPNRLLSALGRFNLIFILVLLAPSNPQTYNPQTFLLSVLLLLLATGLLFATQILIPPVSNDRCRQWLLASARRDLKHLPSRQTQDLAPEEAMFRDSGRVARFLAADGTAREHCATVKEVMANFDRAAILRLCDAELDCLANGPLRTHVGVAYGALAARDARSMITSAHALLQAQSVREISATAASAALVLASAAFTLDTLRPTDSPVNGSP
jgi:Fusaric acid resistance protein family